MSRAKLWFTVVISLVVAVAAASVGYALVGSGHPAWFWVFIAVMAYMVIVAISAARTPPARPWSRNIGGFALPPLKTRQADQRRWDKKHPSEDS